MQLRSFKNTTRGLWVGRGLVGVGFVTMCVLVYFQARHGFSLGTWIGDQIGFAVLHGVVDIATALLVSAGAICFAWGMYKMGVAACFFALLLTCVSVLWVSGFMSGRMSAVAGQKATLELLEKHGKWTGGTTYKQADRAERRHLRQEMRENTKQMINVASANPDPHAAWLSSITGWAVEFSQKVLIAVSSGVAQAIKYICLLVGFFLLSNRDERGANMAQATEPPKTGSAAGGSGGREPHKIEPPSLEPSKVVRLQDRLAQIEPPPKPEPPPKVAQTEPQAEPQKKENGSATHKPLPLSDEPPFKPPKVSNALARVFEPSVPKREWSRDEVKDLIRRQRDGKAPKESSYQIADKTGVPQRSIARWQKRLYGQTNPRPRRYAGNGGGLHHASVQ